jgi:ArsR family metal-binding transcriptional regulator
VHESIQQFLASVVAERYIGDDMIICRTAAFLSLPQCNCARCSEHVLTYFTRLISKSLQVKMERLLQSTKQNCMIAFPCDLAGDTHT